MVVIIAIFTEQELRVFILPESVQLYTYLLHHDDGRRLGFFLWSSVVRSGRFSKMNGAYDTHIIL